MKIFVSYSYRAETKWVEDYVLPLIRCFGHEPITGKKLEGDAIPTEVQRRITLCKYMLCFVTRGTETAQSGVYDPPGWVRDELMMGRGAGKTAIEFRESGR